MKKCIVISSFYIAVYFMISSSLLVGILVVMVALHADTRKNDKGGNQVKARNPKMCLHTLQ